MTRAHAADQPRRYVLESVWLPEPRPDLLRDPVEVAPDQLGHWYVADRTAGHVVVLDGAGRILRTVGQGGAGDASLLHPAGIAVDVDQKAIWVGDTGHGRIQRFDLAGNALDAWMTDRRAFGYVADRLIRLPTGDVVFVNRQQATQDPAASGFGPLVERLAADGTWIDGWYVADLMRQSRGALSDLPAAGPALAPDGSLLFLTARGQRVRASIGGDLLEVRALPAAAAALLGPAPHAFVDIAASPSGRVWLLSAAPVGLLRLDPGGQLLWHPGDVGPEAGRFQAPTALAVDASGALAVIARGTDGGRALFQWTADGQFRARTGLDPTAAVGPAAPRALSANDGRLYVLDGLEGDRVAILDRSGRPIGGFPVGLRGSDLALMGDGSVALAGEATAPGQPFGSVDAAPYPVVARLDRGGSRLWQRPPSPPDGAGLSPAEPDGPATLPSGLADAGGLLRVAEPRLGLSTLVSTTGQLQSLRLSDPAAIRYGNRWSPSDVAALPDGRTFVADPLGATVTAWPADLSYAERRIWSLGTAAAPWRLAAGGPEPIVAAIALDGDVDIYTADGRRSDHWRPVPAPGFPRAAPLDLAIGQDGTVFLLDGESRGIFVYSAEPGEPDLRPTPTPDPFPHPLGACRVTPELSASPAELPIGQPVHVTLELKADCAPADAGAADVVLVLDRSSSMQGPPLDQAKASLRAFLDALPLGRHRVALLGFADRPLVDQALTNRSDVLRTALGRLFAAGSTDLAAALDLAASHLRAAGRPEAAKTVLLLTDGWPTCCGDATMPEVSALGAAAKLRAAGIQVVAIGLGPDVPVDLLRQLAGHPDLAIVSPDATAAVQAAKRVAGLVQTVAATDLYIQIQLPPALRYAPQSAWPAPALVGQELAWRLPSLSAEGLRLTYDLVPGALGTLALGLSGTVRYHDELGFERVVNLAAPSITVLPAPMRAYLPVLQAAGCLRADELAVALVVDRRPGPLGQTLAQAKAAGQLLLDWLVVGEEGGRSALRGRVALIGMHEDGAELVLPLSGDYAAVQTALSQVDAAADAPPPTDRGLRLAVEALAMHTAGELPRLVLLADGRGSEDMAALTAALEAADEAGVARLAVGLGGDPDDARLTSVAGAPERYFRLGEGTVDRLWGFWAAALTPPCPPDLATLGGRPGRAPVKVGQPTR